MLDRGISTKFLIRRVSLQSSHANFQKKNFSQKMAAILNFRIFRKIAKHKNAYISKTVLDRAISTKFLTHRVSLQSSHANFQKNFVLPKMAAILNFQLFAQKLQNTRMLILYKWLFSRVLKFANVHCRPASREFIFAVKYIQLLPKLTTCSN